MTHRANMRALKHVNGQGMRNKNKADVCSRCVVLGLGREGCQHGCVRCWRQSLAMPTPAAMEGLGLDLRYWSNQATAPAPSTPNKVIRAPIPADSGR